MNIEEIASQFKPVPKFDGYAATPDGKIFRTVFKNNRCHKILKTPVEVAQFCSLRGYMRINLTQNGRRKTYSVHRIILLTFLGECPEGCEGSHLNGNRTDNRASNLIWENRAQNHQRKRQHGTYQCGELNPNARLNNQQVAQIKAALSTCKRQRDLAEMYGVPEQVISGIKLGRNWTNV